MQQWTLASPIMPDINLLSLSSELARHRAVKLFYGVHKVMYLNNVGNTLAEVNAIMCKKLAIMCETGLVKYLQDRCRILEYDFSVSIIAQNS